MIIINISKKEYIKRSIACNHTYQEELPFKRLRMQMIIQMKITYTSNIIKYLQLYINAKKMYQNSAQLSRKSGFRSTASRTGLGWLR